MNKISKTIMESLESYEEKFNVFGECNPPHCHNIRFSGNFVDIGTHLLQSQIKVIEAVIEKMRERNKFTLQELTEAENAAYGQALEDQISSLNQVKEEIKNILK